MRNYRALVMAALLTPALAAAQTTADGVQALVRGDYVTAARILQPLAEDDRRSDPLAQFFLGTLYQSGHGVGVDSLRACVLYVKAARDATNPLGAQARALADAIVLDPLSRQQCASAAPPNSFPTLSDSPPDRSTQAGVPGARVLTGASLGVDAFVRGDYGRAADILSPLAESPFQRDPVARFFLAMMYENGLGVLQDRLRACALHFDGAVQGPFSDQEGFLVLAFRESMPPEGFQECAFLANIGFHHRFEPVTFTLEPGYWISLDIHGATITLDGAQKHSDTLSACCRMVFAAIEHTELHDRTQPTRRHFIEAFIWQPGGDKTWTLVWRAFEVARTDLVPVTTETLTTISALDPPPNGALNVHEMAHLQVNDDGDTEWEVRRGTTVRKELIDTIAEKQQARAKAEQRKAAEDKVDWSRDQDVHRAPAFTYLDADGCGGPFVFGWSADRSELIAVQIAPDQLGPSGQSKSFDLGWPAGIDVRVHVYSKPVGAWPFCTDAPGRVPEEETYRAVRGTLTISIAPAFRKTPETATIKITGAEFVSASGVRVAQTRSIIVSAPVGRVY